MTPKEIESRFYGPLEFGTAGLRGHHGRGPAQHEHPCDPLGHQGFAQVICAEGEEGKRRGVAICMDCRNHSMEFARAAAEVCAANGIHVRIFESLRPTPELSFAVREYQLPGGHQCHRQPQSEGVQWLQGLLGGRRPAAPSPRRRHRRCSGTDRRLQWHPAHGLRRGGEGRPH